MKLKIMNKEPSITDDEIQKTMNFDALIKQHSVATAKSTLVKKALFLFAGTVIICFTGYFFWPAQRGESLTNRQQGIEEVNTPQAIVPENTNTLLAAKQTITNKPKNVREKKKYRTSTNKTEKITSTESYAEAEPISGFPKLYDYLNQEIIYPKQMVKDSIQGVESVSFIIDVNGKAGQVIILHSLGKYFDEEAFRLLNAMPAWNPALLNGKPVASRVTLPLNFTIQAVKK